jgi:hypothetical protein
MALKEYLGAVILEIDGKEYEVESVDVDHKSGRSLVKPMSKTGRPSGYADGVEEWELKVTAFIPKNDAMNWDKIVGAKLTVYPVKEGGTRTTYQDCVSMSDSVKYQVDGAAKVDVTLAAMNRITE